MISLLSKLKKVKVRVEPRKKLELGSQWVKVEQKHSPRSEGSWSGTLYHDQHPLSPKMSDWRSCYECGGQGHIAAYGPNYKRFQRKCDIFQGKQPKILKRQSVSPVKRQPMHLPELDLGKRCMSRRFSRKRIQIP